MTTSEILFNYHQAIRQAEKLDNVANNLSRLSGDRMESTIGTLNSAWQSDNSPQYIRKVQKVQTDITKSADKLRKIAGAIRTTAEAVRNAELRALEIAKQRTY